MFKKKPLLYNRSAAARVLKISHNLILRFEEWANCVFIIIKGQSPRFWSKQDYRNNFVEFRKQQSKYYEVASWSKGNFEVWNNRSSYKLKALQDAIQCPCDDYNNQQQAFKGKGCCKHGYAVLSFLGFDRLSEYIENHLWVNNDAEEIDYDEANEYIFGATHW
jgi:hypothetical protein